MRLKNWLMSVVMVGALAGSAAQATPLIANSGWQADQVSASNVASDNSPWTFTLAGPGVFTVVDDFAAGDIYEVYSTSGLLFTTTFGLLSAAWTPGSDSADFAWVNGNYSRGQITLGAGTYSFDVYGATLPGGTPAGFWVRLDTIQAIDVPEPAALALFGLGLLGMAAARRRA